MDKPFILDFPDLKSIEVMCVGDFHLGDAYHSTEIMQDIVNWVKAKKNRFITIDGDIFNAALKSSISDVYSERETLQESMDKFENFIDSVGADRILVCIDGNHDQRVWNQVGIDPVRFVCNKKKVRYRSGEAYVTIKLGSHGKSRGKIMYTLFVTHGVGGSRSAGGKLNNLMRLAEIVVADVYVQGHQHDPVIKPRVINEWSSQGNAIVQHKQVFVVTGSCLERGGYAVAKAYPPVLTKSPVLTFSGEKKEITANISI